VQWLADLICPNATPMSLAPPNSPLHGWFPILGGSLARLLSVALVVVAAGVAVKFTTLRRRRPA
jgi:hypothetical protein